ncbi:MAG TPA: alpha-amylase family protein [Streptosporangiaceae bacterium]|jgi:glycosidase
MAWSDYAIFWHVYPLGFTGAPVHEGAPEGAPVHRLRRLIGWLDYAVELGCSGLLLGPIFASETHGYDTVDYYRIDPRLGDDGDFADLVAAARERGLRIVLDGVFNHVGRGFPRFAEAEAGGPGSAAASWFRPDVAADGTVTYAAFEGHDGLVALNHESPEVAAFVSGVMAYWLDRGASGWRLDAAYAVPPAFWRATLPGVRESHPDAWFLGEMIHGDYAGYAQAAGLDAITAYELWKAVWSSLNDGNFYELAWALGRHDAMLDGTTPQTFVGNHDVTRLATRIEDTRHLGHALAVLCTVGGVPSVYYGDEQAFRGVKEDRAGGDDAVRPAFPDAPSGLAPDGWPTYRLHQRLIGFRRRHPWLVRARTEAVHLTNRAMALRSVAAEADTQVITVLNVGDEAYRFPVEAREIALAECGDPATDPADPLLVPAHGWAVLTAKP